MHEVELEPRRYVGLEARDQRVLQQAERAGDRVLPHLGGGGGGGQW